MLHLKTLKEIIDSLKKDINSDVFNEKDKNEYSKGYNEGYKNALIEHLEELEYIYENEKRIQTNN